MHKQNLYLNFILTGTACLSPWKRLLSCIDADKSAAAGAVPTVADGPDYTVIV